MPRVVQSVCEAIEDAYGRLCPLAFDNTVFTQNNSVCIDAAHNETHFDERQGSSFVHTIDRQAITQAIKTKGMLYIFPFLFGFVQSITTTNNPID